MVASTLRRGDVAIVGYNTGQTDGSGSTIDSMEFVILAPIGSGTVIRFTDRQWNGTAFVNGAGDGSFAFTAATDLPAGTVIGITFTGGNAVFTINGVAAGSVSAGGFDLEQNGDAIYVYQGTDANTPTTFLSATEIGDGNSTFNGSLVNTGLVNGVTAVSTAFDSATYHGPTTEAFAHFYNAERLLENIKDSTNWVGDDADGQKALDQPNHNGPYNVAPDFSLWLAGQGGGNAIVHVGGDATVQSGQFGYNLTQLYTNMLNGGNPVLAGARDIAFDTVEGKFFIATGTQILQGNIADLLGNPNSPPTLTVLFTGTKVDNTTTTFGDNNIFNLEVDTVNNIVYFSHGSQISKIGYNTANQTQTILADFNVGNPVVANNRNHVDDFVIHFGTGTIYATSHRITSGQDGDQMTKNYIYKITGLDAGDGAGAFTFANGAITFLPFSPDDDDSHNGFTWAPGEAFPQEFGTLEGVAISPDGNTLYFTTATTLYDHDADGGVAGGPGTPPQLRMGGVYSYSLVGNPTGTYTVIWQQQDDGDTNSQAISHIFGPQGLLDDIEVDPVTGVLYFLDQTGDQLGGVNPPGDEGVWRINANGTGLTFFASVNNINSMGPSSLWINRAPTVLSQTSQVTGVTEASNAANSGATALVQPFLTADVTDVETASNPTQQLAGAVIWVSNNFQSGVTHQDTLTINGLTSGTVNGINFSYNSATGAMTLTGISTFNNYEAAIVLVRFNTSGDDPTAFGQATTRAISWAVSDGLNHSDPVSTTVNVTGINDAPVNTVGGAMNFTEDTTGITGNPNPPPAPVNAVTGISVFDVDADPATHVMAVTLSVNFGTLTIRTDVTGGITAGQVSGNGTSTITIAATQNQINATLAATNNSAGANGLVYTPPANFNGAAQLTVTTNDGGSTGNDPGLTGTGTSEQDVDVKIINVADVNDAPTVGGDGTEDSPTILEDIPFTNLNAPTVATLFGGQFSDALDVQVSGGNPTGSTGDTFVGIAIVANGSNANGNWQYWDGDSWENIGAVSADAAKTFTAATQLRFNPTLDYNGPAPTLTAHLIESGGPAIVNGGTVDLNPAPPTTGAGSVYSAGTVVLSQAITPVNDAPTSAGISGDSVTYTEQQAQAVLLDLGSNATVADVDSANFDGGSLTVAITGGLVGAEDRLVIRLTGTVSFNATAVFVNGTQIATHSGHNTSGPLVFTFDADATPAAVAELMRAVAYNNVGGDNPTDGDRTITWTLVDGDGTANGGVDTLSFTTNVDVDPVNDAPAGTDNTVTVLEDGSHTFTAANFGFSDTAEGHAFTGVVLTTLPASGDLYLDGTAITMAGTFVTAAQIAAGDLTYEPDPDGNGDAYATFTFQVRDNGGTLDGGQDTDQSPNTITFDVTAVNDAPAITNLNGDIKVFVEGVSSTRLDVGVDALVSDPDSPNFDGGSLTVAITGGLVAGEDELFIGSGVTVSGNTVSLGGVQFATFTGGGAGGGALVFSFDEDATPARVQALVRAIGYSNAAGDNPTDGDRTITWTLVDGDGTTNGGVDTLVITSTVDVDPVNDAPSGAANTVETVEDNPYVFTTADFGFTDPAEGDAFSGVYITTLPLEGTLLLDGVAVSAGDTIAVADIVAGLFTFMPDADEFGADYASFTFQVEDDGGTDNGGVNRDETPRTMTIDVTPGNLAPVVDLNGAGAGIDNSASYTEQAPIVTLAADLELSDDGATLTGATVQITGGFVPLAGDGADYLGIAGSGSGTVGAISYSYSALTGILTLSGSASIADYQAVLRQVSFQSTTNNPGTSRTVSWTVTDGTATSTAAETTIAVTPVDDAPSGADSTATIAEDATLVLAASHFGFSDLDGHAFAGVRFEAAPTGGALYYDADGAGGADPVEITTFPTDVSAADIAAGNLTFVPTADLNGTGAAAIDFKVIDSGATTNVDPSANTLTIDITPVNDDPTLQLSTGGPSATLAYTENDSPSAIAPTALLDDIDSADFDGGSLTVSIQANGETTDELGLLDEGTDPGQIGISGSDVTYGGVVIGTGSGGDNGNPLVITFNADATPEAVQALIRAVTYHSNSDDPGTAARTVNFLVTDGDGGSAQANAAVNVTAVNDAPVLDLNGAAAGVDTNNGAFEQDPSGTGSLAPDAVIGDVDSADFDGGTLTVEITANAQDGDTLFVQNYTDGGSNTVTVSGNEISYNGTVVATFTAGDHDTALVITFDADATPTAAQYVARAVSFGHNSDAPSAAVRTVTYTLTDGDGGSATANATVNVTPDNDAPVLTAPTDATISWTEGATPVALMQGVVLSDPDLPANFAGGTITLNVTGGEGGLNLRPGSNFVINEGPPGTFNLAYQDGPTQIGIGEISGIGTQTVTVTLSAGATLARINDLVDDFTFFIFGDTPTAGDRTVTLTFNDGNNTGSIFSSALEDEQTQTLAIVAVNDDPTLGFTGGTVDEHSEVGVVVGTASATDPESSSGFVYSLDDDAGGRFAIDSATGVVTVADRRGLDFEAASSHDITIRVTDPDGGFDTLVQTITLTDVAEEFVGGEGDDTYVAPTDENWILYGNGGDDELHGGAGDDQLLGGPGIDFLFGHDGDDVLYNQQGADVLEGGAGNDIYVVHNSDTTIVDGPNDGNDEVRTSVSYTLGGVWVELLSAIDHSLTTPINLVGNAFNQTIIGNNGANLIDGGGGADVMIGHGGDDLYIVDDAGDQVFEGPGGGNDTVVARVSWTLAAGQQVEVLTTQSHTSTDAIDLTGNEFSQTIFGNFGNNVLTSGLGEPDVLIGLAGDDTYIVSNSGDVVVEDAGGGNDTVRASISYALGAGAEVETLRTTDDAGTAAIDLTGNGYGQTIVGNAGNNVLNGLGGGDLMYGLGGDDTYIVHSSSDQVFEAAGEGSDLVLTHVSFALAAGQEIEVLSAASHRGTSAIDLTGNEFAQTLFGNFGANWLDGKGGSDVMTGFEGADTFAFTTALGAGNVDTITDFETGIDTIALDDAIFSALSAGSLSADAFVVGTQATSASHRLIYDSATGALYYDADGDGAGAAVHFANVQADLNLAASDFLVI